MTYTEIKGDLFQHFIKQGNIFLLPSDKNIAYGIYKDRTLSIVEKGSYVMSEVIVNQKPETDLRTADFYYDLPEELIAQHPLEPRDSSRMMVLSKENNEIKHKRRQNRSNRLY